MSGGVLCAGNILDRALIAEIYMGEQLVDPESIPADPDHFDALEFCRGEKLRAKRSEIAESQRQRRLTNQ